jgi:hypothetical protein
MTLTDSRIVLKAVFDVFSMIVAVIFIFAAICWWFG